MAGHRNVFWRNCDRHRVQSLIRRVSVAGSSRSHAFLALRSRLVAFDSSGSGRRRISSCAMKLPWGYIADAAYLQLLHPVLTLGRLALLAFSVLAPRAASESIIIVFRLHALLASQPALPRAARRYAIMMLRSRVRQLSITVVS